MNKLVVLFILTLFSATAAFSQTVSGVTGIVSDTAGARVPGAKVTLFDTKTSRELVTNANDQGVYTFNNIPPGAGFKLTFEAPGFQQYVISSVQIAVGKVETHNGILTAGQVTETVEVVSTSGDATLNTTVLQQPKRHRSPCTSPTPIWRKFRRTDPAS